MKTYYKHNYETKTDFNDFEREYVREALKDGLKYLKKQLDDIEYYQIIKLEVDTDDVNNFSYRCHYYDEVGNVLKAWFDEEMMLDGDDIEIMCIS